MNPATLERLLYVLLGFVSGMAGTLFLLARDNSFIKGQLSEVIRRFDAFAKVAEHVAVLDKSMTKLSVDVSHAHEKIRFLQKPR